jgi:hypothetical protein
MKDPAKTLSKVVLLLLFTGVAVAKKDKKNPADYPLTAHVVSTNRTKNKRDDCDPRQQRQLHLRQHIFIRRDGTVSNWRPDLYLWVRMPQTRSSWDRCPRENREEEALHSHRRWTSLRDEHSRRRGNSQASQVTNWLNSVMIFSAFSARWLDRTAKLQSQELGQVSLLHRDCDSR